MRASAIRELTASRQSPRIAAAAFERMVQIWDLSAGEKVAEFDTVFSFGGRRLALDPSGKLCVAAGWTRGLRGGVACYEAVSGTLRWHRTDLRQTQRVRFSPSGTTAWQVPDAGPSACLDALTGDTLETIPSLKDIYDSAYSDSLLLEKRKRDYVLRDGRDLRIPRLTSSVLDAEFGPDTLCISEMGGPVRCFETSDGRERWRYDPGPGSHVLHIWHRVIDDCFYGVQWQYEKGHPRTLLRFGRETGEAVALCQLDSWAEAVCSGLDCLVNSTGSVFRLSDGSLINCLPFPERDYPN